MARQRFCSVDEYIQSAPERTRSRLSELRGLVRDTAPAAEERVSYQMPAYYLNGYLVGYAAYAGHIGFYPGASGISSFQDELSSYKNAKGSVQFPLDRDLPVELIKRIVTHRVKENRTKKG